MKRAPVMIRRITKPLLIASILIGLAYARHRYAGAGRSTHRLERPGQTKTVQVKATQKPPSAWEKVTPARRISSTKTGERLD